MGGCRACPAVAGAAPGPARSAGSCLRAAADVPFSVAPVRRGAASPTVAVCGAPPLAAGAVCGTWTARSPVILILIVC